MQRIHCYFEESSDLFRQRFIEQFAHCSHPLLKSPELALRNALTSVRAVETSGQVQRHYRILAQLLQVLAQIGIIRADEGTQGTNCIILTFVPFYRRRCRRTATTVRIVA